MPHPGQLHPKILNLKLSTGHQAWTNKVERLSDRVAMALPVFHVEAG